MYSIIISIIINDVIGIGLFYETVCILLYILSLFSSYRLLSLDEFIFSMIIGLVTLFFCVWYNCKRSIKRVVEKKFSKLIFHLTLWIPLLAYTVYWLYICPKFMG